MKLSNKCNQFVTIDITIQFRKRSAGKFSSIRFLIQQFSKIQRLIGTVAAFRTQSFIDDQGLKRLAQNDARVFTINASLKN